MPLHALEHYDISAKRGFLCRYDPSSIVLEGDWAHAAKIAMSCLLYTSPSPRDATLSRMPSSA